MKKCYYGGVQLTLHNKKTENGGLG